MKSILFLAIMAFSIVACDTPENTSGTMDSDTTGIITDTTSSAVPVDTTVTNPTDTTSKPTDTLR